MNLEEANLVKMNTVGGSLQFPRKKFYFSGAIRGDTTYEKNFSKIIQTITEYGEPLTERSDLYNPLDKILDLGKEKSQGKRSIEEISYIGWDNPTR